MTSALSPSIFQNSFQRNKELVAIKKESKEQGIGVIHRCFLSDVCVSLDAKNHISRTNAVLDF